MLTWLSLELAESVGDLLNLLVRARSEGAVEELCEMVLHAKQLLSRFGPLQSAFNYPVL